MPASLKPQFIPSFKSFDIKAVTEAEYNGVEGLFIEGQPSTIDDDRDGEYVEKDAFDNEATADYLKNPVILYDHGLDSTIGKKPLGTVVEWKMKKNGPWIKAFIPKPSWEPMLDLYDKIKAGVLKAFSIGGVFERVKNAITKVFLYEISVEPVQSNPNALFEVAAKSFDYLKAVDDHTISESITSEKFNSGLWMMTELFASAMHRIRNDTDLKINDRLKAVTNVTDEFKIEIIKLFKENKDVNATIEALSKKWGVSPGDGPAGTADAKARALSGLDKALDGMETALAGASAEP